MILGLREPQRRRFSETLQGMHTPIATARKLVFASIGQTAAGPQAAWAVARALAAVQPRRVLLESRADGAERLASFAPPGPGQLPRLPEEARRTLRALPGGVWGTASAVDHRHFDVVCIDHGHAANPDAALAAASRGHALCLVASSAREVADPAIALAEGISAHPAGVPTVVALCEPPASRAGWAALIAERAPVPVVRLPLVTGSRPAARARRSGPAEAELAAHLLASAAERKGFRP